MSRVLVAVLLFVCGLPQANAWGNRGHELVAYIAYMHLTPEVRARVDALIQLNPCFSEFKTQAAGVPAAQQSLAVFMLAATWPDRIKLAAPQDKTPYDCQPGFTFSALDGGKGADGRFSVDIPPDVPEASQNIGYTDDRRHQYWHFIDEPISCDGTATEPAPAVNVLTEVEKLSAALNSDEAKELQSYDLVWVEHLTGDIHQPLHDAERYSKALPNGDEGGNSVSLCPAGTKCRAELHAYWDDLPGSDSSLTATIKLGATFDKAAAPSADDVDIKHPEKWVDGTVALAKTDAYGSPFDTCLKQYPTPAASSPYHATAMKDMQTQIVLAGYRLAGLIGGS